MKWKRLMNDDDVKSNREKRERTWILSATGILYPKKNNKEIVDNEHN